MKNELNDRLFTSLKGDFTPKFLATKDETGTPNVVPIISIQPFNRTTLIFGNFLMLKTERNLKVNTLVSVAVLGEDFYGATIRGKFKGFQPAGEYVDIINSSNMLRYNAYTGIRSAGVIEIVDISTPYSLSKIDVLSGNIRSKLHKAWGMKLSKGQKILHPQVAEKFQRIAAVKVCAFIDETNHPFAIPVMSLQPVAPDVLIFRKKPLEQHFHSLKTDMEMAATVITMDPVAFQVKGIYRDLETQWGAIILNKAYHASVPLQGKEIASVR
ncbi:pyridoxamine 5'-phosphate oxidase family protein [candidate division CSSED10-310 bacterium]|uniref:Pyridoxamine 5'-phosphate oxidase family protein n=1 Tax=candidate division CSSED10-310 bacterium TaxID=2855610 RepID=A0ABV6YRB0_UNCC1